MKRHFEICMASDGRYFFRARKVSGEVLVESTRYVTRQGALEGLRELLKLCQRDIIACYDRPRHAWYQLNHPDQTRPPA